MKSILEIIKGNCEWIDTLSKLEVDEHTGNQLTLLIEWLENSNYFLDKYDDTVRQTKTLIDMLTKLP